MERWEDVMMRRVGGWEDGREDRREKHHGTCGLLGHESHGTTSPAISHKHEGDTQYSTAKRHIILNKRTRIRASGAMSSIFKRLLDAHINLNTNEFSKVRLRKRSSIFCWTLHRQLW